jgi:DNA-binding transcriptional regulator YhcF (GntR family)
LISALHLGRLQPGSRLPSIRTVSAEMAVDHRVVAQAYRRLEGEGLVEVRPRSGIYAAAHDLIGGEVLGETVTWLAATFGAAVQRRIRIPEFAELVRRATTSRKVLVACAESSHDQLVAYCREIEEDLGLDSTPMHLAEGNGQKENERRLASALEAADVVLTTRYQFARVEPAARALHKPVVCVTVHEQLIAAVQQQLRTGRLVAVMMEPTFGERLRLMYRHELDDPAALRIVLASDSAAIASLDPAEPILITRAAHEQLGPVAPPLLFPHSPTFAPATVNALMAISIRLNLEAAADNGANPDR